MQKCTGMQENAKKSAMCKGKGRLVRRDKLLGKNVYNIFEIFRFLYLKDFLDL